MKSGVSVRRLCLTALGAVINIVCPFLSMALHLPIFMDSIGTIFVTTLLGPKYGIMAGLAGSIISGISFDIYSLYYAPVQILTACMAWLVMRGKWGKWPRMVFGGIAVSLPTALASAVITAAVFGGQTSSSTSYLVVLLQHMGVSLTAACFMVQILFEYLDKLTAMLLTRLALSRLPLMKGVMFRGTVQQNHR